MDVGTTPSVSFPQHRATAAIGDRDVPQKGSFYRRRSRDKKQQEREEPPLSQQKDDDATHSIDIRV